MAFFIFINFYISEKHLNFWVLNSSIYSVGKAISFWLWLRGLITGILKRLFYWFLNLIRTSNLIIRPIWQCKHNTFIENILFSYIISKFLVKFQCFQILISQKINPWKYICFVFLVDFRFSEGNPNSKQKGTRKKGQK